MSETLVPVNEERAQALEAAVSAGDASSVAEAVANAVDAWLTDQALAKVDDEVLQRLWREGIESGDADAVDFAVLKAEARRNRPAR
jgi:Arc/MetJ-type ribon-helix-helix transcriptional regulator